MNLNRVILVWFWFFLYSGLIRNKCVFNFEMFQLFKFHLVTPLCNLTGLLYARGPQTISVLYSDHHCTVGIYTALHCTALHCTALHCKKVTECPLLAYFICHKGTGFLHITQISNCSWQHKSKPCRRQFQQQKLVTVFNKHFIQRKCT